MRVDDCLLNVSRLIKFNVHLFGLRGLPFACSVTSGCNATSTCVKVGPLVYSSWMQSLHSSFCAGSTRWMLVLLLCLYHLGLSYNQQRCAHVRLAWR